MDKGPNDADDVAAPVAPEFDHCLVSNVKRVKGEHPNMITSANAFREGALPPHPEGWGLALNFW